MAQYKTSIARWSRQGGCNNELCHTIIPCHLQGHAQMPSSSQRQLSWAGLPRPSPALLTPAQWVVQKVLKVKEGVVWKWLNGKGVEKKAPDYYISGNFEVHIGAFLSKLCKLLKYGAWPFLIFLQNRKRKATAHLNPRVDRAGPGPWHSRSLWNQI